MSQENFEFAKKGIEAAQEAYAKDDIAPWRQRVEKIVDPELLLEAGGDAFTEGEWRGQEGAIGFVANQMEVLEQMWMRLDEFIDVDDDRFIVGISFGGQARHTAIPVKMHPFHFFTLRDGKILRWQIFLTREEALEAAGLKE
jgi:SnoaL-like domain